MHTLCILYAHRMDCLPNKMKALITWLLRALLRAEREVDPAFRKLPADCRPTAGSLPEAADLAPQLERLKQLQKQLKAAKDRSKPCFTLCATHHPPHSPIPRDAMMKIVNLWA